MEVIFKTNLSWLLSLVFVSLSLVFVYVLFSCFDLLLLLVLAVMLSSRIYLLIAILGMLQVVVFVVLELTFVIWYLSVVAVRWLVYSLTIANLLQC